eukprot:PITA_02202
MDMRMELMEHMAVDLLVDTGLIDLTQRNDRGYLPDEFKKAKPPTFDRDVKKPEVAEAWILEINKFFKLHEYIDNMKARIVIFSLKGKADMWWEGVKQIRDIRTYDLSWREFKRLFRKKYLFESGFPLAFRDRIEYDEPRSLEEVIGKLKHYYEQLKHKTETKTNSRDNVKNKGKWDKKQARPQGTDNKENVAPPKRFHASNRGQGHRSKEKSKDRCWKPIECWTCGKDHHMRDYPHNQGGRLFY